MFFLIVPFPPSVNTYWGFHGHRRFLTKKANDFKQAVAHAVSQQPVRFGSKRLSVEITLYAPTKRACDIDNYCKSTLDALVQSGLFDDDSQVDTLLVTRGEIVKGGKTTIIIKEINQVTELN